LSGNAQNMKLPFGGWIRPMEMYDEGKPVLTWSAD